VVNEVNHTPEFHGAMEVVEVDIAGKMVEYVLKELASEQTLGPQSLPQR